METKPALVSFGINKQENARYASMEQNRVSGQTVCWQFLTKE